MAALNKKGCCLTSGRLGYAMEAFSKHALIDLIVDRARAELGEQATDEDVANHLQPLLDTVSRLRGDKRQELRPRIAKFDRWEAEYKAKYGIN